MNHKINTFGALAGLLVLVVAIWQLDHLAAPLVWPHACMREIARFSPGLSWFMLSTDFYDLCILGIIAGYVISVGSLWFWED